MTYDGAWQMNDVAKDNPYQYNGKELNLDHGLNWSDYGARWYDACVGRWSSVDPLADSYTPFSPYTYVLNNPLIHIDPDGMRVTIVGDDDYKRKIFNSLVSLALSSKAGAELVNGAFASNRTLVIGDTDASIANQIGEWNAEETGYETLAFDLGQATKNLDASNGRNGKELAQTIETGIAHEIAHFLSPQTGKLLDNKGRSTDIYADEVNAVEQENRVRKEMGLPERTHYGGLNVYGKGIEQSKYKNYYNLVNKKGYAPTGSGDGLKTPLKRQVTPLKIDYKMSGGTPLRNIIKSQPKTIWTISN